MKDDPSSAVPVEQRRLAAIMFTDIVGFSRQMGDNEAHTLQLLAIHNQIIQQAVAAHHGAIIKTVGDAFLVDFPSVVNAVQCAQQVQAQLHTHNTEKERTEQIHVRIGIHLGDIVQQNGDVFGDGVNVASRLQTLAEPDTICISHVVYQEVEKKLPLGTVVWLGRPKLKNIVQRFQVYVLLPEQPIAHSILSRIYLTTKQYDQAVAEAEHAIVLDPNWAEGKAIRLNPRYPPSYQHALGLAYCQVGRYEEAITAQKGALSRNPNFFESHTCLAACYSMAGRDEEARAQVKEILRLSPNFSLEIIETRAPWKDPADGKAVLDALHKAGLK